METVFVRDEREMKIFFVCWFISFESISFFVSLVRLFGSSGEWSVSENFSEGENNLHTDWSVVFVILFSRLLFSHLNSFQSEWKLFSPWLLIELNIGILNEFLKCMSSFFVHFAKLLTHQKLWSISRRLRAEFPNSKAWCAIDLTLRYTVCCLVYLFNPNLLVRAIKLCCFGSSGSK